MGDNCTMCSMDELLGKHLYHIPVYQREYSWEEDQIEDFWADLLSTVDEERPSHFMGQFVVNKKR